MVQGNRRERSNGPTQRECTYTDFLKCQPMNFKGTEGVVGSDPMWKKMDFSFAYQQHELSQVILSIHLVLFKIDLTCGPHIRAVRQDVAYAMPWTALKRMLTDKYCPRGFGTDVDMMFPRESAKEKRLMANPRGNHLSSSAEFKATSDTAKAEEIEMQGNRAGKRNAVQELILWGLGDLWSGTTRTQMMSLSLIDIIPTTLDHGYDVELADDIHDETTRAMKSISVNLELLNNEAVKCLSDEPLAVSLDEIHIDDKLCFVEEPVEIMDREVKRLKRSRIPMIKVHGTPTMSSASSARPTRLYTLLARKSFGSDESSLMRPSTSQHKWITMTPHAPVPRPSLTYPVTDTHLSWTTPEGDGYDTSDDDEDADDDDTNDEEEPSKDEEDDEEEEHLAPADSSAIACVELGSLTWYNIAIEN
ncbi:hypothetical protein Tco_0799756 [Tanacetum coccineum]|uniref:Reverse transcriptase domain-containing protein n=1 Tax=Tanacetum coccineum TaxID=301880 RepID=A0ABQ4ZR82_9ASTR